MTKSLHAADSIQHVRAKLPPVGGNNFYRDSGDWRTAYVKTLCGADVTSRDVDIRTAKTKAWKTWPTACQECTRLAGGK